MSAALSSAPIQEGPLQQRGRNIAVNGGGRRAQRSSSRPRKITNIVVGKKVVDGIVSWRGADVTTELYVGNVHSNVSVEDARKGITDLGVDVIDLEVVGRHRHFQSFRVRIKKMVSSSATSSEGKTTTTTTTFFSYRLVQKWNLLPAELKLAPTLTSFKNRLDERIMGG